MMKIFRLILSRIKQYMINNRTAFLFYFIGSITCGIILIYVYGNTIPVLKIATGNSHHEQSYRISLFDFDKQEAVDLDLDALENLIQDWSFEGDLANPQFILQKSFPEEAYHDAIIQDGYATPTVEAEYYDNMQDVYPEKGTVEFDGIDKNATYPPIILPSIMRLKEMDKPTFTIEENEYEIIGVYAGVFTTIIPYEVFIEQYNPDDIIVRFPQFVDHHKKEDEIMAYLQSYFPNLSVNPPIKDGNETSELTILIIILSILYSLALSAISFISTYMFEKNRTTNIIYRMVGCSNKKLALIGFVEMIILTLSSTFISLGIYMLFYDAIFSKLNLTLGITYEVSDYLIISLIMVVVSIVLYVPQLRRMTKETIQHNRTY